MKLLNYHPFGQGNEHLVMLHGFAMDSCFLAPCAKQLSQHYQVHLFDLPGFGQNEAQILENNLARLAEQLLQFMPPKAIWMGWSLGGLITTWIAIHHPERVKAVINVSSSPCFIAQPNWPGIPESELLKFAQNLKEDYTKTLNQFLALQLYQIPSHQFWIQSVKHAFKQQKKIAAQTLDAGLYLLASTDLRKKIQSIQRPCLYLFGEKDRLVPSEIASKITSSQIQTCIIPQASHLPFLSHPEIFICTLQNFLNLSS